LRPKTTAALNLTIFPSSGNGSLGRHITTSGGYDDSISGVATPQISLGVGKYWMIPSTYNPGFQGAFQLIVYSTAARVNVTERLPEGR
jgi:calpain-7